MKHVAAVLLLALANKEINEQNINEIISSVGAKPSKEAITLILAAIKGKKPEDLIKEGLPKLASAVAAVAAPIKEAAKEDKKPAGKVEKKKEEPKEEEEDMGFGGLF